MGLREIQNLKANAGVPRVKKPYIIPKKSAKKIKMEILGAGDDAALELWFEDRKKDLKGVCAHCGGKTWVEEEVVKIEGVYRNEMDIHKHVTAHILPKKIFKSVKTHPLNFIELCFWGNNCHTNFDNCYLDIMDLNCFDTVVERFQAMYPHIDKKERRYIPSVLMNYIEIDI